MSLFYCFVKFTNTIFEGQERVDVAQRGARCVLVGCFPSPRLGGLVCDNTLAAESTPAHMVSFRRESMS
jgi:hypothetical protein